MLQQCDFLGTGYAITLMKILDNACDSVEHMSLY